MSKDTAAYRAREMHKYYEEKISPTPVDEIVLKIFKSAECELKREEIIQRFKQEQNCKDLDISELVSGALNSLVKHSKMERTQHGYYKVL